MKTWFFVVSSILISGCASSSLIQKRYNPRGGVVSYKNGILTAEGSRESALSKMDSYCFNGYIINSETAAEDIVGAQTNEYGTTTLNKRHVAYIDFTCK